MGFYGPLRFNLSKSGGGVSASVKGLRAGVDARGKGYVAGGRCGLYFRERVGGAQTSAEGGQGAAPARATSAGVVVVILLLVAGQ